MGKLIEGGLAINWCVLVFRAQEFAVSEAKDQAIGHDSLGAHEVSGFLARLAQGCWLLNRK